MLWGLSSHRWNGLAFSGEPPYPNLVLTLAPLTVVVKVLGILGLVLTIEVRTRLTGITDHLFLPLLLLL